MPLKCAKAWAFAVDYFGLMASIGVVYLTSGNRIVLNNAGFSCVNGLYVCKRERDSDEGTESETEDELYWEQANGGCHSLTHFLGHGPWPTGWYIVNSSKKGAYFTPGGADAMPASGWTVYDGVYSIPGLAPAPTIIGVAA